MRKSPVIDVDRRKMRAALDKYLTCVICRDVQCDNHTCVNGHPHCARCLERMAEVGFTPQQALSCSVCRVRRGWSQPRIVMDFARCTQFLYPCGIDDCPEQCTIATLQQHRAVCPHKLFECPYECDHRAMPFRALIDHVCEHKRTIRMSSKHRVHIVAYAQTMPFIVVIVLDDKSVVCVSLRALRFNDSCVAVRAMAYGNAGRDSDVVMWVRVHDMCSDDDCNTLQKAVPYDDTLPSVCTYVHGYDNFVTANNSDPHTATSDTPWARRDFCAVCPEVPYSVCSDMGERVFAFSIWFDARPSEGAEHDSLPA